MTDKSHVSMEQQVCLICGAAFDTGSILLDRRLRQSLDSKTVTGFGFCPADKEKLEEGFIALVEIDTSKGGRTPEDAWRTGAVVMIRATVWSTLFNTPPPTMQFGFIDLGMAATLLAHVAPDETMDDATASAFGGEPRTLQ